jgi:hypothetical protein
MSGWLHSGPLPPVWPPDRFEVRSSRPGAEFGAVERYHYADSAHEAALRLREAGLARQVLVIRLDDGVTLFDLVEGVDVPVENW